MGRLGYLCLQATRQGQASHAHVHEIISGLERRGWSVKLFEPEYAKGHQSSGTLERLRQFVLIQWRLWRERHHFDVIYLRTHFGVFPTCVMARLHRVPVVAEMNGTVEDLFISYPATRWLAPVFRWMFKLELRSASAVIAVTPGLAQWVEENVSGRRGSMHVIGNGANIDLFRPGRESDFDLPENYVTFVGAMAVWQGVDTLVEATESESWPPDVSLVIVGDRSRQKSRSRDYCDAERVVCLGQVRYEEVPGVLAGGIAGLCPSKDIRSRASRGLSPLKVFETLSCGVPVVVTDFPGLADLVRRSRSGIVVPPEDPVAFADAVRYLWDHRSERKAMGARGRLQVAEEHSWDAQAERTQQVLKAVLSEKA